MMEVRWPFDAAYAARTEFRRPLVDSTFTRALITGLSVSNSRPAMGIVKLRTTGFIQDGVTVIESTAAGERPNVFARAAREIDGVLSNHVR